MHVHVVTRAGQSDVPSDSLIACCFHKPVVFRAVTTVKCSPPVMETSIGRVACCLLCVYSAGHWSLL